MIWRCNGCVKQFSVKIGTIFEESPIPFSKWLPAMWLVANCKNGISSCELARDLAVTQKTAWFMLHRIRLAFKNGTFDKVGGEVEIDETYIGGKSINMHFDKREAKIKGRGAVGKAIVMGFLERGGKVRTLHIPHTGKGFMESRVLQNVKARSNVFSDAHRSYDELSRWYAHATVDHAVTYVQGQVHTNGIENYWSLLKRTIKGTYVSVEPFHLVRYLDEQAFRYNERKDDDRGRFIKVLGQVVGRRLTYNELTGKMPRATR